MDQCDTVWNGKVEQCGGPMKHCGETVWWNSGTVRNSIVEQWNSVEQHGGTVEQCGGILKQCGGTVS